MLKDILGDRISKSLTPTAVKQLEKSIVSFTDRNSDILLSFDLSKRYSFSDGDREVLYRAIGVTEAEFTAEIKASKQINKTNKKHTNPFYIASILTAREFVKRKSDDHAKLILQYMTLMMYVSIHKGKFKYNANQQIMDYTIAHLDQSFRIRKSASLYAFLYDNTEVAFTTYKDRILRGTDADLTWVIDAIWTRIKGKMSKIATAFYENHKNGNYLNVDVDSYSEGDYHEIDNNYFIIDRLTNKVYIKLINRQYDNRLVKYAITQSDTSYDKLSRLIEDIIDGDDTNIMRRVISSMIEYYLLQSGKTPDYIARGDFVVYMKTAYTTNTEMAQMVFIKNTIDQWLADNMYKYGKANYGKTVKQQYRKSIYMFLIFMINTEAKIS